MTSCTFHSYMQMMIHVLICDAPPPEGYTSMSRDLSRLRHQVPRLLYLRTHCPSVQSGDDPGTLMSPAKCSSFVGESSVILRCSAGDIFSQPRNRLQHPAVSSRLRQAQGMLVEPSHAQPCCLGRLTRRAGWYPVRHRRGDTTAVVYVLLEVP